MAKIATLFTSQKSMQNRTMPFGLGTNTIGLRQALVEGSITSSHMFSTSWFTTSQHFLGKGRCVVLTTWCGGVSIMCQINCVRLGVLEKSLEKVETRAKACHLCIAVISGATGGMALASPSTVQGNSPADNDVGYVSVQATVDTCGTASNQGFKWST